MQRAGRGGVVGTGELFSLCNVFVRQQYLLLNGNYILYDRKSGSGEYSFFKCKSLFTPILRVPELICDLA